MERKCSLTLLMVWCFGINCGQSYANNFSYQSMPRLINDNVHAQWNYLYQYQYLVWWTHYPYRYTYQSIAFLPLSYYQPYTLPYPNLYPYGLSSVYAFKNPNNKNSQRWPYSYWSYPLPQSFPYRKKSPQVEDIVNTKTSQVQVEEPGGQTTQLYSAKAPIDNIKKITHPSSEVTDAWVITTPTGFVEHVTEVPDNTEKNTFTKLIPKVPSTTEIAIEDTESLQSEFVRTQTEVASSIETTTEHQLSAVSSISSEESSEVTNTLNPITSQSESTTSPSESDKKWIEILNHTESTNAAKSTPVVTISIEESSEQVNKQQTITPQNVPVETQTEDITIKETTQLVNLEPVVSIASEESPEETIIVHGESVNNSRGFISTTQTPFEKLASEVTIIINESTEDSVITPRNATDIRQTTDENLVTKVNSPVLITEIPYLTPDRYFDGGTLGKNGTNDEENDDYNNSDDDSDYDGNTEEDEDILDEQPLHPLDEDRAITKAPELEKWWG